MYGKLVYRIAKRYTAERARNPFTEYPYFAGQIADLVDADTLAQLPALEGEYTITYNDGDGARHTIRVYFDDGIFEADGVQASPGDFDVWSEADA